LRLLEIWAAKAMRIHQGKPVNGINDNELAREGYSILSVKGLPADVEVIGENMENARRKVVILKPQQAWDAYCEMLHYYAVTNMITYLQSREKTTFQQMHTDLRGNREKEWVNLGGQVMLMQDLDNLRSDIGMGKLTSWKEIHERYDHLWEKYQKDKQKHALATLCYLHGKDLLSEEEWKAALDKTLVIQQYISDQVYISRKKDFDNPFRHTTFRNKAEMKAAIGSVDDNSFILQVRQDTEKMEKVIRGLGV
jgi:hypothetical protein